MKQLFTIGAAVAALTLSPAFTSANEETVQVGAQEPAKESVLLGDFAGCVKENMGVQGMSGACLEDALRNCTSEQVNSPSAIVCFMDARDEFKAKTAEHLDVIATEEPGRIALIAGVEVKYDDLTNNINCQRQRELNFLGGADKIQIEYVNSRCEAMASARTYIQLLVKSGWMNK